MNPNNEVIKNTIADKLQAEDNRKKRLAGIMAMLAEVLDKEKVNLYEMSDVLIYFQQRLFKKLKEITDERPIEK